MRLKDFRLNPIQMEAVELAKGPARTFLMRGGAGSGKSVCDNYLVAMRAIMWPETRHACFRSTAVDARAMLFTQTFKDVLNMMFEHPSGMSAWDGFRKDGLITLDPMVVRIPNFSTAGKTFSTIQFGGLDDNAALQRVMGADYSTVLLSEAQLIDSFEVVQAIQTRLRQKVVLNGVSMRPKCFIDMNPPSKRHWSYKVFVEHTHPITGLPLSRPEDWINLRMNAEANLENLADDYLENLQDLDPKRYQQYVAGEWYDEVDNPLFSMADIAATRHPTRGGPDDCKDLKQIVVSVDPATSKSQKSDETGIVVVGVDENEHGFVLADHSAKYHPNEWAEKAIEAARYWKADFIVAEKNQGGDMVSAQIWNADRNIPVKLVHASRGKEVRAEPTSQAFKQHRVHLCGKFPELESQLLDFELVMDRKKRGSPDRVDALVHGLNAIMLTPQEMRDAGCSTVDGFYT